MFLANNTGFLLQFAQGVIVARLLGPSGKGYFALVFLFPGIAAVIGELGLGNATLYFLARASSRRPRVLKLALATTFVVGVVLWGGIAALSPQLVVFYPGLDAGLVRVGAAMAPTLLLVGVGRQGLLGMRCPELFNLVQALGAALSLICVVTGFVLIGPTVSVAVYSSVLAGIGAALITVTLAGITWRRFEPGPLLCARETSAGDPVTFRRFLGYGLRTHTVRVAQFLNYRLDQLIIPIFLGTAALGLYTVAVAIAERLWNIAAAVQMALVPRMAVDDSDTGATRVAASLPMTLLVTIAGGAALSGVAYPAIPLIFGRAFAPAFFPMVLLIAAGIPIVMWKIVGTFFIANDMVKPLIWLSLAALVTNAAGNLLLAPLLGLKGVAVASLLSYGVTGIGVTVIFHRRMGTSLTLYSRAGGWRGVRGEAKQKADCAEEPPVE